MSVGKLLFTALRNLLNFWPRFEIDQIKTIQFDRIINNLLYPTIQKEKQNFESFIEIQ
jgi:hypothetical protein